MANFTSIAEKIDSLSRTNVDYRMDTWKYAGVLSDTHKDTSYGAVPVETTPFSNIRDDRGRFLFMINYDRVGFGARAGD